MSAGIVKRRVTRKQRAAFLEHVRGGWTLTRAAQVAGSDRRRFWELARNDEGFADELELARNEGIDRLEDEIVRAATEGWTEEDVIEDHGEVVRRITKHRKRPELLARVREWRRPPVEARVTAHYGGGYELPTDRPPVTLEDVAALARELGARPDQWILGGLFAGAEDVVDAEAVDVRELEAGEEPADVAPEEPSS